MKRVNKFLGIALAAVALCGLCVAPGFAAEGDDDATAPEPTKSYKYTVALYSGSAGDFASGDAIITTDVEPGSSVALPWNTVILPEDSLYYAKGVRLGGLNSDDATPSMTTGPVNADVDYVVAYGLKKNRVAYTVSFVDNATGRELAPTVTYHGDAGDKPVVTYHYVEGYVPQAYHIIGTLSKDGANAFVFKYTPVPTRQSTEEDENGETRVLDENGNPIDFTNGGNGADGVQRPADTINIDDTENPLAQGNGGNPLDFIVPASGIIAGIVGVLALLFILLAFARRKKNDQ